jgi:hypothetical protein
MPWPGIHITVFRTYCMHSMMKHCKPLYLNTDDLRPHTHHVMDVWPCSEDTIFWDVMLCSVVKLYWHFRRMSVNFHQITHCDIPKDSTLHSYCHENFKPVINFLTYAVNMVTKVILL